MDAPRPPEVLLLREIPLEPVVALLARYGLRFELVAEGAPIPGSYWGEPEAGLVGGAVHARADTPVHSLLHEAAHLIVAPAERRAAKDGRASCRAEGASTGRSRWAPHQ